MNYAQWVTHELWKRVEITSHICKELQPKILAHVVLVGETGNMSITTAEMFRKYASKREIYIIALIAWANWRKRNNYV